ncbi:MAG: hypothetical protein QF441_16175 [Bacteriovoracaceae bacterium]|jgi:hypothetical protein|nr:hypothetical protein [Bacteriovoracaceae bacterium]|tara:strand:- start:527 stop:901 length:375 start_codon:yes stop_codon:yes gene_type:complete
MKSETKEKPSNIIEVSFSSNYQNLSQEFGKSQFRDPVEEIGLDPVEELLHEFDDLTQDDLKDIYSSDELQSQKMFHQKAKKDYRLSVQDDLMTMSSLLIDQIKYLKDDVKRLNYYLNELGVTKD